MLATDKCSDTYTEVFVKGTQPTKRCEGHVTLTICTESEKIANEYCPDTEEKAFNTKPEKEQNPKWSTNYGDNFSIVTEHCDIHKKPEEKPPEPKPEEKPPENQDHTNTTNNTVEENNTVNNTDKPSNNDVNNVTDTVD